MQRCNCGGAACKSAKVEGGRAEEGGNEAKRPCKGAKVQRWSKKCADKGGGGAAKRPGGEGRGVRPARPRMTGPVIPTLRQRTKLKGRPETG